MKFILAIYVEKIKQVKNNEIGNPLYVVCYEFFLHKYGFKNISEKKFLQFTASLHFNKENLHVKFFGKMLGIF